MKNIVGVHFWDKKANICICDDYNIYTDAMELPMSIRNANVLKDENAFRLAFEKIRAHMQENMGVGDFDVVLAVPDDLGLSEVQQLQKMAENCSVNVVRTFRETAVLATYVNQEFRVENGVTIISAFASDDRVSAASYEMGDTIRRLDTILVTEQAGDENVLNYVRKAGPKLLFEHMPDAVFFTGGFNAGMTFEQAAAAGVGRSGVDVKMLDSGTLIQGLGFLCGNLEKRPVAEGFLLKDAVSVYPLGIAVDQEILRFAPSDLASGEASLSVEHFPEPEGGRDSVILYEERKNRFQAVAKWYPGEEKIAAFRRRPVRIGLETGEEGVKVFIQDKESGYRFLLSGTEASEGTNTGKEESITDFIESILPIIDNLEYAAKYAEDDTNPYARGILQSYQKAVEILEQKGVVRITGEGEPFDFNLQNAVAHVADGDLPENTVKQVMQAGYMYQGKVLRTAQVIVAN